MSSEAKKPRLEEEVAVTTFRRYLCINTSQPNPDYGNIMPLISVNHTTPCGDVCSFCSSIFTRSGKRYWFGL